VAGFVDTTVAEIDNRLEELKAEMAKLQAARSALTRRGPGRGASAAAPATPSRRGGRRQTRSRGRRSSTRGDQALALVREKPGITIPEIAQSLGIEPNYLYRVMPNLVKSGQVKRDGQGWHPAEG
jgi:predicted HTH transcriptional regulator